MSGPDGRLRLRRGPVRLALSPAPWASAGYLLSYWLTGAVLFTVTLTAVVMATAFSFTLAGIPLLVAAAVAARWCASAERARLRAVCPEPVHGRYRQAVKPGILAQVRARWQDPATWRDLAYLLAMFAPLLVLDVATLAVWLVFLAGLALPAWYWAVPQTFGNGTYAHGVALGYFPNGPHGPGAYGVFVDTMPKALLAAAVFLVLFLLFNYVLVAAARLHASLARALLREPADPLTKARQVLGQPGPLQPFLRS
jgi:putative sensor protein